MQNKMKGEIRKYFNHNATGRKWEVLKNIWDQIAHLFPALEKNWDSTHLPNIPVNHYFSQYYILKRTTTYKSFKNKTKLKWGSG